MVRGSGPTVRESEGQVRWTVAPSDRTVAPSYRRPVEPLTLMEQSS